MHFVLQTLIKYYYLDKRSFFFAPWNQGRECVPIILGSTIEFNFATMRQEVVLCYPPTSDAAHTSMTAIFPGF